jgi:predicted transcriptional regulator of viral defense system
MGGDGSLLKWVEGLQEKGYLTFTRQQAELDSGRSAIAVQSALRRLRAQGRIATPRRGFHVIVPVEYRSLGSPPGTWFVDELMAFLGQPYYVGLLSAAAIHGAAHQQPMVLQVITDRPTRALRVGRVAIKFSSDRRLLRVPVMGKQTETGSMKVSTPEATAFDLVRFPAEAGHWSNVATVLGELAEMLVPRELARIAPLFQVPDAQRLGYLLDTLGHRELTGALRAWLEGQRPRALALRPGREAGEDLNQRWKVWPNVTLEVEE